MAIAIPVDLQLTDHGRVLPGLGDTHRQTLRIGGHRRVRTTTGEPDLVEVTQQRV